MKNFSKIILLFLIFLPLTALGQVWTTPIVPPFPSSDYFGLAKGNNQNIFVNSYVGSATEAYTMVTKISELNGSIQWSRIDTLNPGNITSFYQIITLNNKSKIVYLMGSLTGSNYYLSFRDQNSGDLLNVKQIGFHMMITNYGDSILGLTGGNGSSAYIFDENGNQKRQFVVINSGQTIYSRIPKVWGDTLYIFGAYYDNGNKGYVQKMLITTGQILWRVNFLEVIRASGDIDYLGNSYVGFTVRGVGSTLKFQIVKLNSIGDTIWNIYHSPGKNDETNGDNFINDLTVSLSKNQVVLGGSTERDSLINTNKTSGYTLVRSATTGDSITSFKIIEDSSSKLSSVQATIFDENGNLYVLGKCYYQGPTSSWGWVKKYDSLLTEIVVPPIQIASQFELHQNYPNPFNPTTNINFDIQKTCPTKLIVYDALGREIATLVNEELSAGSYQVDWSASDFPSGVYFYRLTAGEFIDTKKMTLLK